MTRSTTVYLTYLSTLFVLLTILAGGLVHATGSGLACPDWPLCFGQYFPDMTGAVLYEHSHRIIAGFTGVLVWLTGIVSWFDDRRTPGQRWLLGSGMILIVIQALVGGLTVIWRLPSWVSTTHFILAQSTFVLLVVVSWSMMKQNESSPNYSVTRFTTGEHKWIAGITMFLIAVQMVVGAWLRHIGSPGAPLGNLCKPFPFCEPAWINYMTDYFHFYYVWHRILAVLVTVSIVIMAWVFREYRNRIPACYYLAWIAVAGVFVQILLGALTVQTSLAVVPATLHLATADIMLVALLVINLELWLPGFLTGDAHE